MTEKLYYKDSYIAEFDAKVENCEPRDGGWLVTLDKTAFFPEGGGQPSDVGFIGDAEVTYAKEVGDDVLHYTDKPLEKGSAVHCKINFDRRFSLMQNHGGEHILSGVVNRRYGLDNVGFHMGSEDITVDYSGYLDREQLLAAEREANEIIYKNLPIKATFPSPEELKNMTYRSKKELTGAIRIVEIENCDRCACCAPHLSRTGEIGVIKLLDFIRYKGGVRVHLHCGRDALADYEKRYEVLRDAGNLLSVKQKEVKDAVERLFDENGKIKAALSAAKAEIMQMKIAAISEKERTVCHFEPDASGDDMRKFADLAADKTGGTCAVFSGVDGDYKFVIISRSVDLSARRGEVCEKLSAKCGGDRKMLSGRASCDRETIEKYLKNF